jgi:hypothetical protein
MEWAAASVRAFFGQTITGALQGNAGGVAVSSFLGKRPETNVPA